MGRARRVTQNRGMRTLRGVASACLAVVIAAFAMPGAASADAEPLAGAGAGMSAPAGVVETPDGGLWVADDAWGVCRLAPAPEPRLVESQWCQPEAPEGPEAPHLEPDDDDTLTPEPILVEVPPAPGARPVSVSGLVFDARTDNFYVADRASSGGGIWRLHLDRSTGVIDRGELIAAAGTRVQAVTLGPATTPGAEPDVFYITKRGGVVMRIADPATDPRYPRRIGVLGDDLEVGGMVATDDALYLADGRMTRVPFTAAGTGSAEVLPGFQDVSVSAVAVDPGRGRLYAGTSNLNGEDVVRVVDLVTGATEPYEVGFAGVTALGLDAGGRVLVVDDPGVADGTGAEGRGRLWRVGVQPLGRPQARITAGPPALSKASSVTLAYAARDGATFECRLDDGAFEACPGSASGQHTYAGLAEGEHRLSVRAKDSLTGLPASRSFRLDRTAPNVTVELVDTDVVEGGPAPRMRFTDYEVGVTYTCSVDGRPFSPCGWYEPVPNLAAGVHVLRVVAVDAAGNASDPDAPSASVTIRVGDRSTGVPASGSRPVAAPSRFPAPSVSAVAPVASSAPAAAAPAPRDAVAERKPLLFPFTLRFRRAASAPLRFGLRASPEAVDMRVSVKNWLGRTVVTRVVKVRPNAVNRLNLTLTRSEQRRLKPGRYLVTAVLRTARGTQGNPQTHWLRVRPAARS
ncbi:MAG: large repetitive protein [Solirubrobacteraceae bacterium]|nr:large repetitive protein [Solirubrobacteraceae bacterium]